MKNSAMINLNGESTKLSVRQLPGEGGKAQYEVCVGEEIFRFTNNRIVSVNFQKEFTIKGETFLFIVYLQEMDVVHNGVLLLRNKPYKKAPTFNLAMILPFLLSVLIPILSLGKALRGLCHCRKPQSYARSPETICLFHAGAYYRRDLCCRKL